MKKLREGPFLFEASGEKRNKEIRRDKEIKIPVCLYFSKTDFRFFGKSLENTGFVFCGEAGYFGGSDSALSTSGTSVVEERYPRPVRKFRREKATFIRATILESPNFRQQDQELQLQVGASTFVYCFTR